MTPNQIQMSVDRMRDQLASAEDIGQMIGLVIGASSMAWEDVREAGTFQSEYAIEIGRVFRAELEARMAAESKEALAVKVAWTTPGPEPQYHQHMQGRLRREWPVLGHVLDELARKQ